MSTDAPPHPASRRTSSKPCDCGCGRFVQRATWRFASRTCQKDHERRRWIDRWLAGEEDGVRGGVSTSAHIQRWLRETRGERCEECDGDRVHPTTGRVPVTLHHKDGNGFHNRPENVCLLCPNCHSLTETFGSLNRGKGRKSRNGRRA